MKCPVCGEELKEQVFDLCEEEAVMAVVGESDANCSYQECLKPFVCPNKHTIYIGRGDK